MENRDLYDNNDTINNNDTVANNSESNINEVDVKVDEFNSDNEIEIMRNEQQSEENTPRETINTEAEEKNSYQSENTYTMENNFGQSQGYTQEYSNYDVQRTPPFYTENCKKSSKKGSSLKQLVLVAVMSSILGGAVVGGVLMFVPSNIQPAVKNFFGTESTGNTTTQNLQGAIKKVEIEKSESAVTAIAEKVSPSIVGIRVTTGKARDFFGFESSESPSEGSGIIIKSDGYIMTNNHVIANAFDSTTNNQVKGSKIEVILPSQKDKPYIATLVGRDQKTDLAVIKIEGSNFPAAELGDSSKLKVGEMAVAIGNPGGLEFMGSVTVGVISGLNRTVTSEDNGQLKLLQTDASINPGNSGGALVNSQGQVIGINSVKIVAQGFEGLGFAIPINEAKKITDNLIEFKYVKGRPWLGIAIDSTFTEDVAKQYDVPAGLLVQEVTPLSGAYKAGLQRGDIIVKVDGKSVKTFNELEEIKNKHKPGDTLEMDIYRYDSKENLKLKVVLTEKKN